MSNNIAGGGVILGFQYIDADKLEGKIDANAERFHCTPVFPAEVIPRGRYCHIGEGIWLHRCAGCDDFILSYGPITYLSEFAAHEATHAELLAAGIVGYNVGILA